MRTLFEMDKKNYDSSGKVFYRPSVRSIIIRGGRVAMVHSLMYDYYKFPGGGIESGETRHQALIRETAEESGLCVVPDSIQEYGCVRRIEKSDKPGISVFVQNNFYYFAKRNRSRERRNSMTMRRGNDLLWNLLRQNMQLMLTETELTGQKIKQCLNAKRAFLKCCVKRGTWINHVGIYT